MIFKRSNPYDKRTKRWFAILPVTCRNVKTLNEETRWLEFVSVHQTYCQGKWCLYYSWKNDYFM